MTAPGWWHAWSGDLGGGMRVSIIVGPAPTPDLPADQRGFRLGGTYLGPLAHVATWDHEPTAQDRAAAGLDDDDDEL